MHSQSRVMAELMESARMAEATQDQRSKVHAQFQVSPYDAEKFVADTIKPGDPFRTSSRLAVYVMEAARKEHRAARDKGVPVKREFELQDDEGNLGLFISAHCYNRGSCFNKQDSVSLFAKHVVSNRLSVKFGVFTQTGEIYMHLSGSKLFSGDGSTRKAFYDHMHRRERERGTLKPLPGWVIFCDTLLKAGYTVTDQKDGNETGYITLIPVPLA